MNNLRMIVLSAVLVLVAAGGGLALWWHFSQSGPGGPSVSEAVASSAPAAASAPTTPPPPAPASAPVDTTPVPVAQVVPWARAKHYVFPLTDLTQAVIAASAEPCALTSGSLVKFDAQAPSRPDQARLVVVTSKAGDCQATAIVETPLAALTGTLDGMGHRLAGKINAAGKDPDKIAQQGGRAPLLLPGKKTLYQRILTRPGALLANERGGTGEGQALPAFSMFFVYGRAPNTDGEWLEVGAGRNGVIDGWLPASQTIPWKQTLTVNFNNPAQRGRSMFFRSPDDLSHILAASNGQAIADSLIADAGRGKVAADFPLLALEPPTYIDFTKHFYLLPILDWRETRNAAGFSTRLLRVASLTQNESKASQTGSAALTSNAAEMANFTAAVTFVVDTTRSMQPYIERTQVAVSRILQKINGDPLLKGKVSFGLVAFRNNLQKTPALGYVNKVFVDLDEGRDIPHFLSQLATLKATDVSSHSWDEDSLGGIVRAVNELKWDRYAGRYIIMFTDAGSLRANDPLGSTQLDPEQVNRLLQDKNIACFVLHLRTQAGKNDHAFAADQYKTLAELQGVGPLYFPIEGGAVDDFGHVVDSVVDQLSISMARAARGEIDAGRSDGQSGAGIEGAARDKAAAASRVMQLAYLGREREAEAPPVLDSWIADRDIGKPDLASLEVRVLLTKNELSDLQQTMKLVVEAAKKSEISPGDFFNQLRSAAASLSRDPGRVGSGQARKLADLGLIGEYLDDLPYKSKIMTLDQETWESWGISEQQAFVDEIEAKIRLYQRFYDDTDRWVTLDSGKSRGDEVYPVPVDSLP